MAMGKDQFRAVMGSFAAGVTVITCVDPAGRKGGLTATAFSSLSLEPPLCLVCLDRRAASHAVIVATRRFAVNVLAAGQESLSNLFASRSEDKLAAAPHRDGAATGCPLLDGALAWAECEVRDVLPGGDHDIIVGELVQSGAGEGAPLLYWRGAYADLAARSK